MIARAFTVRVTPHEARLITAHAEARGISRTQAVRELVVAGAAAQSPPPSPPNGTDLDVRLSDLEQQLTAITALLTAIGARYGTVWIESLIGTRVLLDHPKLGLLERARDLTTNYLKRLEPEADGDPPP